MWQRVEVRSEVVEVAMVVVKVVVEGDEAKVVKLALFKGVVAIFLEFWHHGGLGLGQDQRGRW